MSDETSRLVRAEENYKSILTTLAEMKDDARRREEKLDSMSEEYTRFKEHREFVCKPLHIKVENLEETLKKIYESLDLRIRNLEAFKWKAMGAVGVITFVANFLAQKLF